MSRETTQTCAIAKTAELLSDPWTMLIIRDLIRNDLRFCELERQLEGISTRTLTSKLKTLEDQGIIQKLDHGYTITSVGKKLQVILGAMEDFGKKL
jgi:DNA-binding HxlR family transcriptional regulator